MDRQTLAAYELDAAAFAKDWLAQPAPVDLQEVVERFFVRGGTSADIGCGCGREVAWLHANGFSAVKASMPRKACSTRRAGDIPRSSSRMPNCPNCVASAPSITSCAKP